MDASTASPTSKLADMRNEGEPPPATFSSRIASNMKCTSSMSKGRPVCQTESVRTSKTQVVSSGRSQPVARTGSTVKSRSETRSMLTPPLGSASQVVPETRASRSKILKSEP